MAYFYMKHLSFSWSVHQEKSVTVSQIYADGCDNWNNPEYSQNSHHAGKYAGL